MAAKGFWEPAVPSYRGGKRRKLSFPLSLRVTKTSDESYGSE